MNKASGRDRIPAELFQILKDDAVKVLHAIRQQIWKTQQWPQDWKRLVFIPIPEKGSVKECSNYHTIALISRASKVMLKILQARLQQYVNHELPDVQTGFRKGRGSRAQTANICWIIEKAREFQKNIYFCFIDYAKAFDWLDHNQLWKMLQEMGIPDHLTCLLRNLYAGQEATVRTRHGTTEWFQIGKGVHQFNILPAKARIVPHYLSAFLIFYPSVLEIPPGFTPSLQGQRPFHQGDTWLPPTLVEQISTRLTTALRDLSIEAHQSLREVWGEVPREGSQEQEEQRW